MVGWFAYAAASAALLVGLSLGVSWLVPGAEPGAVWLAAGIAWVVQLAAFGALVAGRYRGRDFLVSWASGMVLRVTVVAGVAFWLTRTGSFDAASALVSLVGFVFVLVILEPLFLRLAD
jgi:hypothetical protein